MDKSDAHRCPKVFIVVLLYNGLNWIEQCLKSILQTDYPAFEVVVVDNGSNDDGVKYIKQHFKDVIIIKNGRNYGTAGGNNIGIDFALKNGADYVALLNQDIKVEKTWLKHLVDVAGKDGKIGILSPLLYDYEGKAVDKVFIESVSNTTYFEDLKLKVFPEKYFTDFVLGTCVLIKREVFLTIGLFDPLYFIYSDDYDFCRRARYRGFKIACVPASQVFHYHHFIFWKEGLKEPSSKKVSSSQKLAYLFKRNYLIYLLKNPYQPFLRNIKHVFVWTNWLELFKELNGRYIKIFQAFCFIMARLPGIYANYQKEKRQPCYLMPSEDAKTTSSAGILPFYEILKYRDLLMMLTVRDIRIRYKQAAMGFLWAVFMPIVAICAGILIKKAMAVVSGKYVDVIGIVSISVKVLPWTFFINAIRFSVQSLVGNRELVTKIYFPKEVLPMAAILACLFDFLLAVVVLTLILSAFKLGVSIYLLWLPLPIIFLFLFTTGLGLLLAAANLFFRDVKYVVEIILMFGIFFTPVFYNASSFGNWENLLLLNPVGSILESINHIIVFQQMPNIFWLMYSGACSVFMFFLGFHVFNRKEPFFAENI